MTANQKKIVGNLSKNAILKLKGTHNHLSSYNFEDSTVSSGSSCLNHKELDMQECNLTENQFEITPKKKLQSLLAVLDDDVADEKLIIHSSL